MSKSGYILSRLVVLFSFVLLPFNIGAQSKIIFSRSPGKINTGGTSDIMIYDPQSKTIKLLLKGTVGRRGEYAATTSPDNSKIIFNTYRFSGWKLGIGDYKDGKISNVKKFTNRGNYEYSAKYAPNSSLIAYQEYNWGTRSSDIFIADSNGENIKHFFKSEISSQNLGWTRDSKSIVFTRIIDQGLKLFVKSIEGNTLKRLSTHNANDFAPSTSKTEDKIAFLSDKTGRIHLFVMNTDGSGLKNITPSLKSSDADGNNIWAYRTSWSPDGKQIVFNVMVDGDLELFVVNADGTNLTQITKNGDTYMTPFWMN